MASIRSLQHRCLAFTRDRDSVAYPISSFMSEVVRNGPNYGMRIEQEAPTTHCGVAAVPPPRRLTIRACPPDRQSGSVGVRPCTLEA